ncbi:glycosyltransferase family 2 protein [Salinisphaera aquimarina]|uniref:Glycosyltransferase family 2 protein n=1 Tax=Salinisphaera aquimarina TaxID=2094031 RepID=A0ABV7ESD0_9GAMM
MLDSLANTDFPEELAAIWLIENGTSTLNLDLSESILQSLPLKRVALLDAGVARSRQWLVDHLQTGVIVFLDDDVIVDKYLLASYSKITKEFGLGHFFGGALRVRTSKTPPSWIEPYLPASARGWEPSTKEFNEISNPLFLGANFCAYSEDIIRAGGFDFRFGPGSSVPGTASNPTGHELVMQQRLTAVGCTPIYAPEAIVTHNVAPECYTQIWVLHREYRNALTQGILHGDRQPGKPPRWMWRKLASLWIRAQGAKVSTNHALKLKRLSEFYNWKGFVNGIRLSARSNAPDE